MNKSPSTPTDHVAAWILAHQDVIGEPIKFERRDEPARTLVAWFETSNYLIDISAWDHACCLDIIALNKATSKEDYGVYGDCDGAEGLTRRLNTFSDWLQHQ